MNRQLIDDALEQAKVLGIRNILALRGDAPRSEEYRDEATPPEQDSNKDFTWAIDLVIRIRATPSIKIRRPTYHRWLRKRGPEQTSL
jgi:5,10-methylenetetrahydrofolate reductase